MIIQGRFCLSRAALLPELGCTPWMCCSLRLEVPLGHHLASLPNTQRFPLAAFLAESR